MPHWLRSRWPVFCASWKPEKCPATPRCVQGTGAQILRDLGVSKMRVMSAPRQLHGLSGFGLEIVGYVDDEQAAASA